MKKAILKFNLENVDDKIQHLRCIKSDKMFSVLFELSCNSKKKNRIYARRWYYRTKCL